MKKFSATLFLATIALLAYIGCSAYAAPVDPLGDPEVPSSFVSDNSLDEAAKALLNIRNIKSEEQYGSVYVSGEIANPTKISFNNVQLIATITNANGVVIIRQNIFVGCCANAMQATPFNFSLDKPVDYHGRQDGNPYSHAIGPGGRVDVVLNKPLLVNVSRPQPKLWEMPVAPINAMATNAKQPQPSKELIISYSAAGVLIVLLCAFGVYRFVKWRKAHPSKLNPRQRQIRSAWIFSIIWSVWILSVVGDYYATTSDKLLRIFTATLICGVFWFLRHVSLREKPKQ